MSESNIAKKALPLVQLIPAVAVAAVVFITLPSTAPILAEVPQRLSEVAETEQASASSEQEKQPALPYADGVYTGSSRGYGGKVEVQVTMEGGYITDIQITDASHETAAFLKRASRVVNTVKEQQTWDVDVISEATYSSRGILGAIKNALTGEEVINPEPPKQTAAEPIVEEEFTAPSAYIDGVYTASAQGFGGLITVQVTVANDTITDISVISAPDETGTFLTKAKHVISSILSANSPDVDAVSGATYSSTGIINAVKLALKQAAANPEQADETVVAVPETPAESEVQEEAASSVMEPVVEVVVPEQKKTGWALYADEIKKSVHNFIYGSGEASSSTSSTSSASSYSEASAGAEAASSAATDSAALSEAAASAPESTASEQAAESVMATPAAILYRDGTYTGVATCTDGSDFCYDIRVSVTVSGGVVTDVQAATENDTSESPADNKRYFDRAKNGRTINDVHQAGIVEQILGKQSADSVDAISGATYSSLAIQSAAAQALAQAK